MPRVVFTSNLLRHVSAPECLVSGHTVREALDAVFAENPRLAGYVVDDQQRLRKHVFVFIGGEMVKDKVSLSDAVDESSEVYVMQALSGG